MIEEFILNIEGTGLVKHLTFNMLLEWESKEDNDGKPTLEIERAFQPVEEAKPPRVVLQDGIVEWCQQTLEHDTYFRCLSLEAGEPTGGPELIFGSEADRACFVLKWL